MCTSPMWRIPCPKFIKDYLFKKWKSYNETNGAFVFPVKDDNFYHNLTDLWRIQSPRSYAKYEREFTHIPCGKCLECKINDSKEWAQRSVCEAAMHHNNWFITLTYDDEHIPSPIPTFSRHSLEFGLWSPLLYEDFQSFVKRLRERLRYKLGDSDLRFFMCGEYGPTNGRPHFHVIFYDLPLIDLERLELKSVKGRSYTLLTSKLIEDTWGKGFIKIGEVNWETSAYVGRYVLKKFNNLEEFDYCKLCYDNFWEPLPPEMRQASRRPGLGREYYDTHKDEIYSSDTVVMPNGKTAKPCSYYDRLFDLDDPELLDSIKAVRKDKALIREANEFNRFGSKEAYEDYKRKKSEQFSRKISKLKRPL